MICWQIINYCNRSCPFCISHSNPRLSIPEIRRDQILKRLAGLGVEKLSISGGEPFAFGDLELIIKSGLDLGLEMMITTNGDFLLKAPPPWVPALKPLINVSFFGTGPRHSQVMGRGHYESLIRLAAQLKGSGVSVGANYLLSNSTMPDIGDFLSDMNGAGVDRILFIIYMPVGRKIDVEHSAEEASRYLPEVRSHVAIVGGRFRQGVRMHDYRSEAFFPVCDENANLFFAVPWTGGKNVLGNLFDDFLVIPEVGKLPIAEAMQTLWRRRIETSSIVAIE